MRFCDEPFLSGIEKERILKLWIRFLSNGFERRDFTRKLYHHLSTYCDFIAHYNIHGFYAEYFTRGDDKIRFLKQFDRRFQKNAYWLKYYADINNALVDEAAKFLPVLYAAAKSEQKKLDLIIVERLLGRYGLTLTDALKQNPQPELNQPQGTQANLF